MAEPGSDRKETLARIAKAARKYLPGDEEFGDSLSTGGTKTSQVLGKAVSEMDTENPSALRELGLGALQVFRAIAGSDGVGEVEMAIVFTDLVGFSSWALSVGDERALALVRAVDAVQSPEIENREGKVVKRLGDGLMASFYDPQKAVDAALAVQEAVAGIEIDGYRPRLRAGVHLGAPQRVGGDLIGVDVNVAARVADAAKSGEVLVSEQIHERLADGPYKFRRRQFFRAKGAPRGLKVYSVRVSRG
jgi:adenylate cyclase